MAKKGLYGVNTYRERTKRKIGRHKKRLNKQEKRQQKGCQVSYINLYIGHERNKQKEKNEKQEKRQRV